MSHSWMLSCVNAMCLFNSAAEGWRTFPAHKNPRGCKLILGTWLYSSQMHHHVDCVSRMSKIEALSTHLEISDRGDERDQSEVSIAVSRVSD
jgi:hypothetical protein